MSLKKSTIRILIGQASGWGKGIFVLINIKLPPKKREKVFSNNPRKTDEWLCLLV